MPNLHRQEKLGELIAVEVSDLLRTRIKDPRVGFASITQVEVSGDLRHAKIFVSVMGDEEEKKSTMEALRHATGFLRHELAGRLTLRFMPDIAFRLDSSIEHGSHILDLINQLGTKEPLTPVNLEEDEEPEEEKLASIHLEGADESE